MPDTQCVRSAPHLWKLPVFALVSPPIVLAGAALFRSQLLLGAFWLLGALAPLLGLATLAILTIQFVMARPSVEPERMSRGRTLLLGALAVVSPVWLWVMFLVATGFSR
jgi:hypothetical protein